MPFVCEELEADLDCEVSKVRRMPMRKRPRAYSPRFDRRRKDKGSHGGMHHRRDKRNYL